MGPKSVYQCQNQPKLAPVNSKKYPVFSKKKKKKDMK